MKYLAKGFQYFDVASMEMLWRFKNYSVLSKTWIDVRVWRKQLQLSLKLRAGMQKLLDFVWHRLHFRRHLNALCPLQTFWSCTQVLYFQQRCETQHLTDRQRNSVLCNHTSSCGEFRLTTELTSFDTRRQSQLEHAQGLCAQLYFGRKQKVYFIGFQRGPECTYFAKSFASQIASWVS